MIELNEWQQLGGLPTVCFRLRKAQCRPTMSLQKRCRVPSGKAALEAYINRWTAQLIVKGRRADWGRGNYVASRGWTICLHPRALAPRYSDSGECPRVAVRLVGALTRAEGGR
jgi:hypothetical protein